MSLLLLVLGCGGPRTVAVAPAAPVEAPVLRLLLTVEARVDAPPVDRGPLHLWIPVPPTNDDQQVVATFAGDVSGVVEDEQDHGNRFWHGVVPEPDGSPLSVTARFEVVRREASADVSAAPLRPLTAAERSARSRYLAASARVPVGADDPVLGPVLADLRVQAGTDAAPVVARTIYDYVIDTMEYKKVGTGWGNGDTYWACSAKYGNCTDYHSLFLSLARSEGIPARFEMGLPISTDRDDGKIGGYHCWLQFWLPQVGWVPIDASEADKNPAMREAYFGGHGLDRVLFTRGRDLRLGSDHRGAPLNYLIYPYAEVGGEAYDGVTRDVHYRVLP